MGALNYLESRKGIGGRVPAMVISTLVKKGRRRCKGCGRELRAESEAVRVTATTGWHNAGRLKYWLCQACGAQVEQALDRARP